MNLINHINKCIVTFQQLWDKAERGNGKQISKLDKKMFIMMICLSLPENLLQRERISVEKIEKILEQNFVNVVEQESYQIVAYMGSERAGNVKVTYMEIVLNIYYNLWNSNMEKERYIKEMLCYPFYGWVIDQSGTQNEIVKRNAIEFCNEITHGCQEVYSRENLEDCLAHVRKNFERVSINIEELARMTRLIKTGYADLVKMRG